MKRDMDIVRLLLLQLEGDEKAPEKLKAYDEPLVVYNAALLVDSGLVEGAVARGGDNDPLGVAMNHMTWAGHDFLDAARDETLWKKAKQTVMKPAASYTFEIVKEYLKAEIKKHLGA
jgi:Hypothetical protein (DUF2513)